MSILSFSRKILDDLDGIYRKFWWGDLEGKKDIHIIKWKETCNPLRAGVWGLGDLIATIEPYWLEHVRNMYQTLNSYAQRFLKENIARTNLCEKPLVEMEIHGFGKGLLKHSVLLMKILVRLLKMDKRYPVGTVTGFHVWRGCEYPSLLLGASLVTQER